MVNALPLRQFAICPIGNDPAVGTASRELAQYLHVEPEGKAGTVYVGPAKLIAEMMDLAPQVQEEGIAIRVRENKVFLAGGSGRGTLYAVYEFLEKFCGWRFFTPTLETEPAQDAFLQDFEYCYNPPFQYRMNLTPTAGEGTSLFQKRHLNAKWGPEPLPGALGGSVTFATNNAHTFKELLPDSEYFDTHPEYYAMDENGHRERDLQNGTAPCLTNPDVFEIVVYNLRSALRSHPGAMFAGVSQTDGGQYCHCPACRKVNEEEQTAGGTLYRFINRVAATLKSEFPDVYFDTHPYLYSTKPPARTVLADNVVVRLSLMDMCREHALSDESCWGNRQIREYVDGWMNKCQNIYVFEYAANYHNYPMSIPNFKLLYQNMQRFRCYPVRGMTYLGAHTTVPDIAFEELWTYLQSKLLWEPDMDYSQYLTCAKEFLQAQYGNAWSFLFDYLMLSMMQPSSGMHYGPAGYCEWIMPMSYLPNGRPDLTFIRDANKLFDQAEQSVTGQTLEHVRRTRLHLVWYELCTTYEDIRKNGSAEQIAVLKEKYRDFVEKLSRWPGFRISEGEDFAGEFDFDRDPNSYIPPIGPYNAANRRDVLCQKSQ